MTKRKKGKQIIESKNKVCIKIKLSLLVEGDPKALFSIATTPKRREGTFSFPWIAPLYPWSILYHGECKARWNHVLFFESLGMTRPGIEPLSPGPLANALTTRSIDRYKKMSLIIETIKQSKERTDKEERKINSELRKIQRKYRNKLSDSTKSTVSLVFFV